MKLIPSGAGFWEWGLANHLSVFGRMLIEIDHRQKIRIQPRLIAGANKQIFRSFALMVLRRIFTLLLRSGLLGTRLFLEARLCQRHFPESLSALGIEVIRSNLRLGMGKRW